MSSSVILAVPVATLLAVSAYAQPADSIQARHLTGSLYVIHGAVDLIGVSVGEDGVLMVDDGYPETATGVRAALQTLGAREPDIVVNTHWHHAFANRDFADAVIVAHASVRDRLQRTNMMAGREIVPAPREALPDVTFADSLTLHVNGEAIRLIHYPNAHTDGDVVVHFPASNVLMAGDLFVPHVPWIDVASGGNAYGLLAAIEDLLAWLPRDAIVVPGHDQPESYETLRQYRDLIAQGIELVEDAVAAGQALEEVQAAGLPERWRSWVGVIPPEMFLESIWASVEAGPPRERPAETSRDVPALPAGRAGDCAAEPPPNYALENGRWWDGAGFRDTTFYTTGGRLSAIRPARVDSTIDLAGGWVIPPLADPHTHRLSDPEVLDADIDDHLAAGVLYVMNKDPLGPVDAGLVSRVRCRGIEMTWTPGVIAPTWSMVADLYRMLAAGGRFGPETRLEDLDGRFIYLVDDEDDLERRWPLITAENHDFVKVILGFSEEFAVRRGNPRYASAFPDGSARAGLDPALLPEIVRRAHAAGLRVSAHVETAGDFRVAVDAGVDLIAHLPGSWQIGEVAGYPDGILDPWLLTAADARAAAERGVVVMTTGWRDLPEPRDDRDQIHRHNLTLLRDHAVRVVPGSDGAPGSTRGEIVWLSGLGIYEPAELLDMATRGASRVVLPGGRVGALGEAYEASLVVLDADPLADLGNLARIRTVMREGRIVGP